MGIFDHLKKQEEHEYKKKFYKYLVVGSDWASVGTTQFLMTLVGKENVYMMDNKDLTEDLLFFPGPTTLRGDDNIKAFKKLRPEIEMTTTNKSQYFKDQQFRNFGGRGRPYELKRTEAAFKKTAHKIDKSNLAFSVEQIEKNDIFEKVAFRHIKRVESERAEENYTWLVETNDDQQFYCENLIFGKSPFEFLKLYEDKNSLNESFVEFCNQTQCQYGIVTHFENPKTIHDYSGTLLIPQSQTHEWGHFITEFELPQNDKQKMVCFTNIEDEESSEEEISKKIKLIKRTLGRIFDQFDDTVIEEMLWVIQYTPFLKLQDELYKDCDFANDRTINFVGPFAPIEASYLEENNFEVVSNNVSDLTRSLISLHQLQRKLS